MAATARWLRAMVNNHARLGGIRTAWSVHCEGQNPEIVRTSLHSLPGNIHRDFLLPSQAWAQLNRRMRPFAMKMRERLRGFKPPAKIKYEARRKKQHKLRYQRVYNALTYIELERTLSAMRRKADRRKVQDEFKDELGILEAPDMIFPGAIRKSVGDK